MMRRYQYQVGNARSTRTAVCAHGRVLQVLKGISRCLVAEGQLEEAEQRFQKAMSMENARNPGASRAMLEYCQASVTADACVLARPTAEI